MAAGPCVPAPAPVDVTLLGALSSPLHSAVPVLFLRTLVFTFDSDAFQLCSATFHCKEMEMEKEEGEMRKHMLEPEG